MKNPITVRECADAAEREFFWKHLCEYFVRDIRWDRECGGAPYPEGYRETIEKLHDRQTDPLHYVLFCRGGAVIGLASTVIYLSEDGKQFILEFCVFPEYRGGGTGAACAEALLGWGRERGAKFFELNTDGDARRIRFWGRLGFVPNGRDEGNSCLMLLPPEEHVEPVIEPEAEADGLLGLESAFRAEMGEEQLDDAARGRLLRAAHAGDIIFFAARRLGRPIGMCSVSLCFSTFACRPCGVFDDFYVEPAFRGQGTARQLVRAAVKWCSERGCASLVLGSSPGDVGMYTSLGFDARLGEMLACITE